MDLSNAGFWLSFVALAAAGLIDTSALSLMYDNGVSDQAIGQWGKGTYLAGRVGIALIAYLASLLALYLLCREPEEQARFTNAVIVHNWAAPLVSLSNLPLILASIYWGWNGQQPGQDGASLWPLIYVFWLGILILIGIRLLRISLNIPQQKAIIFFIVTTIVSLVCSQGLESLVGLSG